MREQLSVWLCGLILCSTTSFLAASSARAADPAPVRPWTVLVYLNGDNSLDMFGPINLRQMETVGSNDNMNVVVQWASTQNGKTERMLVQKSTDPTKVTSPVVQDMGVVDMGDWHSLVDFIAWGVKNYPAQHYFVDVWDHGSGWHALQSMSVGQKRNGTFHPADISWDDASGHSITTQQLGEALAQGAQIIGHKIDIYGSDACMMGMVEVAGEMQNSVSYFIGSQEVEPGAGWPYDKLLQRWSAAPDMTAPQIASVVAEEYSKSYNPGGSNSPSDATMAVYDLSHQADMESAITKLAQRIAHLSAANLKKAAKAATNSQAFTDSDYSDLQDFLKQLSTRAALPADELEQLQAAEARYVISNDVTDSFKNRANGVSIWLPKMQSDYDSYKTGYETMDFENHTGWGKALKKMMHDIDAAASSAGAAS